MLEAYCRLLQGMNNPKDTIETTLSPTALSGLLELTSAVYGNHAAEVVKNHFYWNKDGSWSATEGLEEAFRLCLTGIG